MQLSKRLQTVAHLVHSGGVVADIGCDHGFTIIYLVMNQLASAGIAMDVADGPLMRAKEHIHQYGLDNRIALRKSDGLQQLVEGEADTILISGIGGALMERILREFPHVTQSAKVPVLSQTVLRALSPQSEIYKVRHALHDLGFVIAQEEMVFDQGKYYTIIRCERGSEHYFTEEEYIYGGDLMRTRHPVFLEYMQKELARVQHVLEAMPDTQPAKRQILREQQTISDILNPR